MDLSAIHSNIRAADLPLDRLANNPHLTEENKIAEVSRQFEAILLRQILTAAQKPVLHTEKKDNSVSASIYQDMISTQMAENISKSGTLGLAQTINQQLSHQLQASSSKDLE